MTKMYESPFLVSRTFGNMLKNKEYFNELVEAAGIEPASVSPLPKALHA